MRWFFLLFNIILFAVNSNYSQNTLSKFDGAYQWCPFPCETYKINADFTFDYLLDGDLFNNERAKGTWRFVGENKIHLQTPKRKLLGKVSEEVGDSKNKIFVQVTDETGALFAGITIKVIVNGKEYQFVTNEDGTCEILRSEQIEVNFTRYSEIYMIKTPQTTRLNIEIRSFLEPVVDSIFLIKKKSLCKIFDDGEISGNCYEKLNKKILKKLFPE